MVSLTNEQRGKELLATRDAALNNYPSSLCGPPGCPSEIREENMPTPKQNGTSAPLIHPEPSRKKNNGGQFPSCSLYDTLLHLLGAQSLSRSPR